MEYRSYDRLPSFTDAVVAIALTLLVLPLAEFARDLRDTTMGHWLGEHWGDLFAFALSFLVIGLYWRIHHQIFESAARIDRVMLALNTAWMFGIVFFPVPTAMLASEGGSGKWSTFVYLLNLLYVSVSGQLLVAWLHRRPALQRPGQELVLAQHLRRGVVVAAVIALAAGMALVWGRYALFLLFLLPPAQILANRVSASPQTR